MKTDKNLDHNSITSLKCDFPDLYGDSHAMTLYAVSIWGKETIDNHFGSGTLDFDLNKFAELKYPKIENENRFYLTTEFYRPWLIIPNISDKSFNAVKTASNFYMPTEKLLTYGSDCFMAWYFKNDQLIFAEPITSTLAAELLTAFSPENLISKIWLRHHWDL